jgi:uracil-DNA glycosylase
MFADKKQILNAMGIEVWEHRALCTDKPNDTSPLGWDDLEKQVKSCTRCELHKTRTHAVFGVGNKHAQIMLIGEAPGANEDLQGEPFVGRAGLLLNEILRSVGLNREDVFIANILKCRPPNNRDPNPQEVQLCTPYLEQQIALIKPKILVAVGRIAAHFLLHTDDAMSKLRGKVLEYGAEHIPLVVTYHPAYLLRSPREKSKVYQDFLMIKKFLISQVNNEIGC